MPVPTNFPRRLPGDAEPLCQPDLLQETQSLEFASQADSYKVGVAAKFWKRKVQ